MKKVFILLVLVAGLWSCEDSVNISLNDAPPVLVVDAWINNKPEVQVIRLSQSQPFFESELPPPVSGAEITVSSSEGNTFTFSEEGVPGEYRWNPITNGNSIGAIGTTYQLSIRVDDESYTAVSQINRVPAIDSITFTFEEERNPFQPEGYYGEFVSTDPVGVGDTYWIRTFKNGIYQNRPFDLTIAFDAGFSQGGVIDGVVFIQPIQDAVNPLNEDLDEIVPYEIGDSLYVEIHSITNEAFFFLQEVQIQTQRDGGFDEIFAEPLENVPTNIINVNENSTRRAIGYFCVSAVESRGRRLTE
ncbi:MAG: DUF4249 domain-containing protein [Cytophagales bacterium]|nr:DUF4249 domain-containing protein [Cytophagales bacterium]